MQLVGALAAGSGNATPGSLTAWQTLAVMGVVAVTILAIGGIVLRSRKTDRAQSLVRSWIALALVAGLVLFCAVTFAIPDANLRSTLFGGLTTSVGAAVAFYFSSKSSDQARKDILDALKPGTTNPGTTNPGTTNPGTTNPGTTKPGTTKPGTTKPDTGKPGTTKPDTGNADAEGADGGQNS